MTQNIEISKLRHHPNNPRKEIGDLTELSESIKAQGLICPLLVVPHEDEYFVIAGNRRLEACKLAGIEEVSCEVAELTDEEAIGVMLTENMLRQNLSSLEENEGFQLMLDMGKDVDQIAEKTGLKADTVKMRAKLSNLNKDNLKKACDAGATIFELAAVADIEDEKERDKLLKKAGTKDFNNAMYRMKQEAEDKEYMISVEQFLRDHGFVEFDKATFEDGYRTLRAIDDDGTVIAERKYMKGLISYSTWHKDPPDENLFIEGNYYAFVKNSYSIEVYRDVTAEEFEDDKKDSEERKARQDKIEYINSVADAINERHENLRRDFILNFNDFKKHQKELKAFAQEAINAMIYGDRSTYYFKMKVDSLLDKTAQDTSLDKALLVKCYAILEYGYFVHTGWKNSEYVYIYYDNDNLKKLYSLLVSLGYQMSEEEEQVVNGTYELYYKEEEPEEDVA